MKSILTFQQPSPTHRVTQDSGGFSIEPIDHSAEAKANFQSIARSAAAYVGDDFVPKAHPPSPPYDLVFFQKKGS